MSVSTVASDAPHTAPNSSHGQPIGPTVVALLLAGILAYQLLVPPIIGLADQGDYSRLWGRFGIRTEITNPDQRYFGHLIRTWTIDSKSAVKTGFLSPDVLIMAASLPINALLSKTGAYDIRSLALVRIVLFVAAAFLILRLAWQHGPLLRTVAIFGLLVVFADVGYIAYFNSGYGEPSSFIFALLAVASYLRLARADGRRLPDLVLFVGSCLLLVWSKPQNVLLAIPLACITLRLVTYCDSRRARVAPIVAASTLLGSGALYLVLPSPAWYQGLVRYIAVFDSLLPSSPNPQMDLEELGADPRLAVLSGVYPWEPPAKAVDQQLLLTFQSRVGFGSLAGFYLRHPGRIWPLLDLAAGHSLRVRPGLGNFEASTGLARFTYARSFAIRSDFARRFGPSHIGWIIGWGVLWLFLAADTWRRAQSPRSRLAAEGIAVLLACAAIQYGMVAILQGHGSEEKGMFLFAMFFDAGALGGAAIVAHRIDSLITDFRGRSADRVDKRDAVQPSGMQRAASTDPDRAEV